MTATDAEGGKRATGSDPFLLEGETVVRDVRRHFAMLMRPTLGTLVGVVLATALGTQVGDTVLGPVLWLVVLCLYARLGWKVLLWFVERIYLTDRRLFITSGVINHKIAAMPVRKLTDITYENTPTGRMLGYGRLVVESAGQNQALGSIRFIPDGDDFYKAVCNVVFGEDDGRPDDGF